MDPITAVQDQLDDDQNGKFFCVCYEKAFYWGKSLRVSIGLGGYTYFLGIIYINQITYLLDYSVSILNFGQNWNHTFQLCSCFTQVVSGGTRRSQSDFTQM